ncbi:hypothetical protein GF389_03455 [Candidatus Dojkabacteria bacterium]|nr:hypothetical protein [Candidatus Dojkabacteria bacterium]
MSEADIQELFLTVVKIGGIVVLVLNAGIGLVLLRQQQSMNSVIRVQNKGLMYFLTTMFLLMASFGLIFSFFV